MIGINIDILPRLWLNDDPAQTKRIDHLLAEHGGLPGSLLVADVVLAGAVRALESAFEQNKHAQLIAVRSLLEETAFAFEDRDAVAAALSPFEANSCGFADCPSLPRMRVTAATSPQPWIEACAGCRRSKCSDLARPSPRRSTVAAQNLINSSLVSVTLRETSGAVVMCTATNCSM